MDFELHDGSKRVDRHIPDYVLITCAPKGPGLVMVVECRLSSEGDVEPIRVVEAWDDDGVDVPVPSEVPQDYASWLRTSQEVRNDLERLND
jgi:hypothetical protein